MRWIAKNCSARYKISDLRDALLRRKSSQPKQKKVLQQWLNSQLEGKAAALAEKLERFEYGNVVSHKDLFFAKYTPTYLDTLMTGAG